MISRTYAQFPTTKSGMQQVLQVCMIFPPVIYNYLKFKTLIHKNKYNLSSHNKQESTEKIVASTSQEQYTVINTTFMYMTCFDRLKIYRNTKKN